MSAVALAPFHIHWPILNVSSGSFFTGVFSFELRRLSD